MLLFKANDTNLLTETGTTNDALDGHIRQRQQYATEYVWGFDDDHDITNTILKKSEFTYEGKEFLEIYAFRPRYTNDNS